MGWNATEVWSNDIVIHEASVAIMVKVLGEFKFFPLSFATTAALQSTRIHRFYKYVEPCIPMCSNILDTTSAGKFF